MDDGKGLISSGGLPLKNATLRVCIDKQGFSLFLEDRTGEIDGNGCLAYSPLLIDKADHHAPPWLGTNKRL
jgi:hypothetical protein